MISKISMKIISIIGAIFILCIFFLNSCLMTDDKVTYMSLTPSATVRSSIDSDDKLPIFIKEVNPAPGTSMTLEQYENFLIGKIPMISGVIVVLWPDQIDSYPLNKEISSISERSSLTIDGGIVSNEYMISASGGVLRQVLDDKGQVLYSYDGGPLYLSWVIPLAPGPHEARYKVISDDGNIYEFNWDFSITGK
jgi:hypothetical protein